VDDDKPFDWRATSGNMSVLESELGVVALQLLKY